MKHYISNVFLGILVLLLFTGCTNLRKKPKDKTPITQPTTTVQPSTTPQPSATPQPSDALQPTNTDFPSNTSSCLTGKIITITEDSLLLCNAGSNQNAGDLYTLSLKDVVIQDAKGIEQSVDKLTVGTILNIFYDGMILESYPAQIGNITAIQVVEDSYDMVGLYSNIIDDLYHTDKGLNTDITYLALDLRNLNNLTEAEKSALTYLLGNKYSLSALQSTYQKLCDEGLIDEKELYFKDGILITISDTPIKKNAFTFKIEKWRGGLGAYGYSNCKASYKKDTWNYSLDGAWIS